VDPERRGDIGQVVLEAGQHGVVVGRRGGAVGLPGVARDAVELEELDPLGELVVVGGQHAAFAGRDVLDRVKL
jgi:hypothetical protein